MNNNYNNANELTCTLYEFRCSRNRWAAKNVHLTNTGWKWIDFIRRKFFRNLCKYLTEFRLSTDRDNLSTFCAEAKLLMLSIRYIRIITRYIVGYSVKRCVRLIHKYIYIYINCLLFLLKCIVNRLFVHKRVKPIKKFNDLG